MDKIRKKIVNDQDLVGIVSSGYSSIEIDLLYDVGHKRLEEALNKTMGSGRLRRSSSTRRDGRRSGGRCVHGAHGVPHGARHPREDGVDSRPPQVVPLHLQGYDFNPYTEARLKHEQDLYGTASRTPAIRPAAPGASDQPQNSVDPTLHESVPKTGNQFSEADLVSDLADLIRMANRANVAMYTIDPRGLEPDRTSTKTCRARSSAIISGRRSRHCRRSPRTPADSASATRTTSTASRADRCRDERLLRDRLQLVESGSAQAAAVRQDRGQAARRPIRATRRIPTRSRSRAARSSKPPQTVSATRPFVKSPNADARHTGVAVYRYILSPPAGRPGASSVTCRA